MKTLLNILATSTAVGLVAFSGSISAYGLSKFCPGAEPAIITMAGLFECAKLVGFSMVHRPAPRLLKAALLSTGVMLMGLNVVGVAGFLSAEYTRAQVSAHAIAHIATTDAHAEASLLERQLVLTEQAVSEARRSVLRARDDKSRAKAAQAALSASTAERDAILTKLSAANTITAQAEGAAIQATGEFATVAFLAQAFGAEPDTMARILITVVSALPDVLAALLMVTVNYVAPKAPRTVRASKGKPARRGRRMARPNLKVIHATAEA